MIDIKKVARRWDDYGATNPQKRIHDVVPVAHSLTDAEWNAVRAEMKDTRFARAIDTARSA